MNADIKDKKKELQKDWSKSFILATLFNGFMIALPVIILIAVIVILVRFIIKLISPLAHALSPGTTSTHWSLTLLALLIVAFVFFILGLFVATQAGKRSFNFFETKFLKTIPFYSTVSNIVEQFRGQGDRPFKQVVLVDAYGTGALMTAFFVERIDENMVVVYVPTAPNPTNGFVFHIKESDIIYTNARTEDAMASVIGMGAGTKKLFASSYDVVEGKIVQTNPDNEDTTVPNIQEK